MAWSTALTKACSSCQREMPATTEFFHPNKGGKFGLRGQCIACRRARLRELIAQPETHAKRKAYQADYIASGRNAARNREWRRNNMESRRETKRRWVAKNSEHVRERERQRRQANRERYREKQRRADAKLQQQPGHVLKKRIKARLRQMLKGRAIGSTEAILGYTRDQLKRHIERQFTPGMTWAALMRGEIHIDHVVPVSKFKITGVDCPDFRACWALSNLRPLWAIDNQKKQAKVTHLL